MDMEVFAFIGNDDSIVYGSIGIDSEKVAF